MSKFGHSILHLYLLLYLGKIGSEIRLNRRRNPSRCKTNSDASFYSRKGRSLKKVTSIQYAYNTLSHKHAWDIRAFSGSCRLRLLTHFSTFRSRVWSYENNAQNPFFWFYLILILRCDFYTVLPP